MTKVLYFQAPDGEYIMTQEQYFENIFDWYFENIFDWNIEKDLDPVKDSLLILKWDFVKDCCTKISNKIKPGNGEWWIKEGDIQLIELGNSNQQSLFEEA